MSNLPQSDPDQSNFVVCQLPAKLLCHPILAQEEFTDLCYSEFSHAMPIGFLKPADIISPGSRKVAHC